MINRNEEQGPTFTIEIFHRQWWNADGTPITPMERGRVVKRIHGTDLDILRKQARELCARFDCERKSNYRWDARGRKHEFRIVGTN